MHKIILYLLLVSSYSFSETINYENAIEQTITNNNKLKTQKLNIEASKLDVKKVKSYSLGKVELSHEMSRTNHPGYVFNSKLSSREASFKDFGALDFINSGLNQNIEPNNLNNPDSRNNFNTKVTYQIPLFTGFKLSTQEDMLKIKEKAETIKLNLDTKSLEYEVLKAYNAAVVAKEFIKATSKAKEAVSLFVQSANEFYKEGLVTKIDKKQARVYELNVQSKIIEAKNKLDIAIAYLRFLTNNKNISNVKELKNFDLLKATNSQFYEYALNNRDDLKILKEYKKSMKKNIELKSSSFYPNVYSHIEYGVNDDKITLDSDKDYYMAMLGIKYTIFDNTRDIEKQKSQIEFNRTSLNLKQLENAIKLEIEKAVLNLNAKIKVFKEKKEAKELGFEILEQSKLMYKNQLISMTELLKQEALFRENEAKFIMSNYEKSLAQANLNLIIGKSLKTDKDTNEKDFN